MEGATEISRQVITESRNMRHEKVCCLCPFQHLRYVMFDNNLLDNELTFCIIWVMLVMMKGVTAWKL